MRNRLVVGIIMVSLGITACGGGGSNPCDLVVSQNTKVASGDVCADGVSPVVKILNYSDSSFLEGPASGGPVFCTGTLISATTILTDKSCVQNKLDLDLVIPRIDIIAQDGRELGAVAAVIEQYPWLALIRLAAPTGIAPMPIGIIGDAVYGPPLMTPGTGFFDSMNVFGYGSEYAGSYSVEYDQPPRAGTWKVKENSGEKSIYGTPVCHGDSGAAVTVTQKGVTVWVGLVGTYLQGPGCVSANAVDVRGLLPKLEGLPESGVEWVKRNVPDATFVDVGGGDTR